MKLHQNIISLNHLQILKFFFYLGKENKDCGFKLCLCNKFKIKIAYNGLGMVSATLNNKKN